MGEQPNPPCENMRAANELRRQSRAVAKRPAAAQTKGRAARQQEVPCRGSKPKREPGGVQLRAGDNVAQTRSEEVRRGAR